MRLPLLSKIRWNLPWLVMGFVFAFMGAFALSSAKVSLPQMWFLCGVILVITGGATKISSP